MSTETTRVPRPVLNYVRELTDTKGWKRTGDYWIWTGSTAVGEAPYALYELRDGAIIRSERDGRSPLCHRVPRNTPYHVSNLFGFWHVADSDMIWLETEQDGTVYYSIMLGVRKAGARTNECLWVCPKCAGVMARSVHETGGEGMPAFLEFAAEQVARFNYDSDMRTCPSCGNEHPPSHGFGEGGK